MDRLQKIKSKEAIIGIIGLGYVGVPLAVAFNKKGIKVLGFDIAQDKVDSLMRGKSYIRHIEDDVIADALDKNLFNATSNLSEIANVDAVIICVPTPLTKNREPDLGSVLNTGRSIAPYLQAGQIIVLESSTYPGTTDGELATVLEESGLRVNQDFYLAYSPEREDPGNKEYSTSSIPKIVGADTSEAREIASALYEGVVSSVVTVSSARTAEAIKLTENIFRSVNIALVNELKIIFDAMDIDIWDVIDGAATKPFGFMPFYPGPGLGGHCIPIDPFYLTYKAREYGIATRFVELAGEINTNMPQYILTKLADALSQNSRKAINGSKILIIGMAYKKNVDDMRESPSLTLTEMLEARGAAVDYHDTYVPVIPKTREHPNLAGRQSVELIEDKLSNYDAVLISTNHSEIDYQLLADRALLIIDTRNAMNGFVGNAEIVKA
jgi:UDP-N-acetyl-D-glucosamine dehydrogenase